MAYYSMADNSKKRPDDKTIGLRVNQELYWAAKAYAVDQRMTLNELTGMALEAYLIDKIPFKLDTVAE